MRNPKGGFITTTSYCIKLPAFPSGFLENALDCWPKQGQFVSQSPI